MVSDTFHFALICTFIAIKIVSPLRGLKLDNADLFSAEKSVTVQCTNTRKQTNKQ